MASFTQRMIGAAKLDVHTYEEVEADRTATGQAMGVVVLSSIASGIGAVAYGAGPGLVVVGTIGALIGWFLWAFVTYLVGTKILPEPQTRSDVGELLRTIGFSASPGVLFILVVVPGVGPLIGLGVLVWMLVAFVVAVRQALDYRSTGRAVAVCLIGLPFYLVIRAAVHFLLGV
ncbi:MAG: YIP1 family protein [Acidobacteria bacterium]|nr:YIP1 family protein [Acidobacteriota bacterium]